MKAFNRDDEEVHIEYSEIPEELTKTHSMQYAVRLPHIKARRHIKLEIEGNMEG